MADQTQNAADCMWFASKALALGFQKVVEEDGQLLSLLEGPRYRHFAGVDGVPKKVQDPVAVFFPLGGIDGWRPEWVFRWVPECCVASGNAGIGNIDEISPDVGNARVVNKYGHPTFRFRSFGVENALMASVGDGRAEVGSNLWGRLRWDLYSQGEVRHGKLGNGLKRIGNVGTDFT